jgi:DNA segregation ATPase FtsK/SpoIIIE-like protein
MKKFGENIDVSKLYDKAVKEVLPYDRVSAAFLQRRFSIFYKDAVKLLDLLEKNKIVGSSEDSSTQKEVLINKIGKK